MKPNPMTPSGAARVLAAAASIDKRTVGDADAIAWAQTLHDLEPIDCINAVAVHYSRTTDYLMPAHIRAIVRAAIADRQDRAAVERGLPKPPPQTPLADRLAAAKAAARSHRPVDDSGDSEPVESEAAL